MSRPRAGRSAYVPELDGVRGIAIAGVMALHFVDWITPTNVVERAAVKISGYGVWGVDLFFVLSGYLITGILIESKGSAGYLRNFYIRRALRIFPLYYGVLLVLCVLIPSRLLFQLDPQLVEMRRLQGWMWPYATNFYLGSQTTWSIPYVSHFWSLAIEEHFYLVWPLVILLLSRRSAMHVCVWLGVSSLVFRIAFLSLAPTRLYWQTLTACRLDALCAGAWFALWSPGRNEDHTRLRHWLGAAAAGVVALSFCHAVLRGPEAMIFPLRTTLFGVCVGCFIHVVQGHSWSRVNAALRVNWLRRLGRYSYGLYVYHGIISYAIRRHPPEFLYHIVPHSLAAAMQITFGVGLSLIVAYASYEFFEVRFLAMKKRFEYSGSESHEAVAWPSPPAGRTRTYRFAGPDGPSAVGRSD